MSVNDNNNEHRDIFVVANVYDDWLKTMLTFARYGYILKVNYNIVHH